MIRHTFRFQPELQSLPDQVKMETFFGTEHTGTRVDGSPLVTADCNLLQFGSLVMYLRLRSGGSRL